jgi:N-acetylglucosamine kinase-like BadF-type ATPase
VDRVSLVSLPPQLAHFGAGERSDARYLLGIDGGATKTLAAVCDLERATLHLGHGGPSNQDAVAAHVHAERSPDWIVVGDVVGAWATATGARPGVGVISGTGSNVFGVGRVGEETRSWRAGGWGHLLGDEGSGYWFGLHSIKAALRDREGSGPPTAISDALLEFFGAASLEVFAPTVYSKPLTKSEIAAFAVETARLAERGDAVARELYAIGARELGRQVAAVIAQTGLDGEFPVGLIGSAYRAGAVFLEPLTRAIRESAPAAQVAVVAMAPVGGSLLLAARACHALHALAQLGLAELIDAALATAAR